MALVRQFERLDLNVQVKHSEALATFSIVSDSDVGRCLQLDTYGSKARKLKGKKSQSIRLAPQAIEQLIDILAHHFSPKGRG